MLTDKIKGAILRKTALLLVGVSCTLTIWSQTVSDARNMLLRERYNSGEAMLHQLIKNDPTNAEAWYWLTQSYLQQNKTKEIKDSLTRVPADLRKQPLMSVAMGHVLLRDKQVAEAAAYFNAALKETKQKNPAILQAVALSQYDAEAGDANYGVELVKKALKRDKRNPALYVLLGDLYRKLQNGSASYSAYEQALSLDPQNAVAKYKLGKIFLSQNNAEFYLKYFKEAVQADSLYNPALYQLYYYYYFRDVNVAMDYLKKYTNASDYSINNEYMMTDLLYASRKYEEAIKSANTFIRKHGENAEPRLYKLIAYSYKEMNDPDSAATYMNRYFSREADSNYVIKDYEVMGEIYTSLEGQQDSAVFYYGKASLLAANDTIRSGYYKKLADLYKGVKDYKKQAEWLGKYYAISPGNSNVDLFNWGVAHYMAKEYETADSVFGVYEEKYPDQRFGYYWRARSNAALDSTMEKGLAIPHYENVIRISEQDTTDDVNRKRLIEAYGYMAAFKANTEKDVPAAIAYFEKLVAIDPTNSDAKRYIEILKKSMAGNQ
ncbi:MAG: tetratricopeptide repeat protein [Chitinophagaceae bacterium]|nr:tetratricopeptide repeat protein [Chitinophagaceae bacterium]